MGDIAEMVLDGTLCEACGGVLEDFESPGYPRLCQGCKVEHKINFSGQKHSAKVACATCGKRVKEVGLADHMRDAHGHR